MTINQVVLWLKTTFNESLTDFKQHNWSGLLISGGKLVITIAAPIAFLVVIVPPIIQTLTYMLALGIGLPIFYYYFLGGNKTSIDNYGQYDNHLSLYQAFDPYVFPNNSPIDAVVDALKTRGVWNLSSKVLEQRLSEGNAIGPYGFTPNCDEVDVTIPLNQKEAGRALDMLNEDLLVEARHALADINASSVRRQLDFDVDLVSCMAVNDHFELAIRLSSHPMPLNRQEGEFDADF